MATRQIKDAKDLTTGELIYFKGHAKATYMSDGNTVEDVINNLAPSNYYTKTEIDNKGYVTSTQLEEKQDTITDLETIRQGAAKGATALQSYTEQYTGTVTGVTVNGSTKSPSSGTVDIGNVATHVRINNMTYGPVNGVVNLGYVNKQLSTSTSSSMTLSPNVYYRNTSTSLSTLTIALGSVSNGVIINEYFVEFTTSSSGTTVSLPSGIKWMNGVAPTFEASTTYQISIVNNLGTWVKFK